MIVVIPGLTIGIISAVVTLTEGGSALECAAAYFVGTAVGGIPPLVLRELSGWSVKRHRKRAAKKREEDFRPASARMRDEESYSDSLKR